MMVSVILPSLNPDEKLMQVVNGLVEQGFNDIIIIDDGSDENHQEPFKTASECSACTVIRHQFNKGKGRALKTGFEYFIANRNDYLGVITADGDNQHRPEDIKKCANEMVKLKNKVILGARDFSKSDIPPRSRMGNKITATVFMVACGIKITDTQTGLRAIPREYVKSFIDIVGERFEYETNMLLEMKTSKIDFTEVKIQTVYIENNKTSHFNPLKDSLRIYALIFKFCINSILSSLIDLMVFTIVVGFIRNNLTRFKTVLIATLIARVISSIFNYNISLRKVFKQKNPNKNSSKRYILLCIVQTGFSAGLVFYISKVLNWDKALVTLIKFLVDSILFFVSFQIQREWVFKGKYENEN